MRATRMAPLRFEQAYRRPEWIGVQVKSDNRTVVAEALRSVDRVMNPESPPDVGDAAVTLQAAPAMFAAGYEEVAQRLMVGPAPKEDIL